MPRSSEPGEDGWREPIRATSQFLGHGLALAAGAALFGWVGSWIGGRVGQAPLLTLLGIMVGAGAGFYSIYLQLVVRPREERESPRRQ